MLMVELLERREVLERDKPRVGDADQEWQNPQENNIAITSYDAGPNRVRQESPSLITRSESTRYNKNDALLSESRRFWDGQGKARRLIRK